MKIVIEKVTIIVLLTLILVPLTGVTVETASLRDFIYGSTEDTAYDNWQHHIVEGLVSPGYNQYAPWDRQTPGFGKFVRANKSQLEQWEAVVDFFLAGQFEDAEHILAENEFPYEIVEFNDTDTDKRYYMLREHLNMEYFDDNDFPDEPELHQHGSFDYGWGLYIFSPDSETPILISAPHPKDDFITPSISCIAFQEWDARYLMISGVGRETTWTNQRPYANNKSTCDPTRNTDHPFNTAYRAFCDEIRETFQRREFSPQIHSYDTSHVGYNNLQVALGINNDRFPSLPIRDFSRSKLDIINASPYVIHPANTIGEHDDILVTEFYSVFYTTADGLFYDHDELGPIPIPNRIDLPGAGGPQHDYTYKNWNSYDVFSPFFHIEHAELPRAYPQTTPYRNWFYGFDFSTQRWDPTRYFERPLQYYRPWIEAMKEVIPHLLDMDNEVPPTTPQNIRITSDTGTRIGLTWDRSYDFDFYSYEVVYAQEPLNFDIPNYTSIDRDGLDRLAAQAHTTITFTSLNADQDYYFAVRAKDYSGNYSDFSNVVVRQLGSARVTGLVAIGRDSSIDISWTANWQRNNRGFKVWKSVGEADEYEVISSYVDDEFLEGNSINNYPYGYVDEDIEQGQINNYRLSYVSEEDTEYFLHTNVSAAASPIYSLQFANADSTITDFFEFGVNLFKGENYDNNFDETKPSQPGGQYIQAMIYRREGFQTRSYQRLLYPYFNPNEEYETWQVRARTNQHNQPITVSLSDNFQQNVGSIFLRDEASGNLYNLAEEQPVLTFPSNSYRNYTLYWGNLKPKIKITEFNNRFATVGDSISFEWELGDHYHSVEQLSLYLHNGEDSLHVKSYDVIVSPNSYKWAVPDSITIRNCNLYLRTRLSGGNDIIAKSNSKISIFDNNCTFAGDSGYHLFANPFRDVQLDREQMFGELSTVFYFEADSSSYYETDSLVFGRGYWITADDEFRYPSSGEIIKSSQKIRLRQGWNLIPNILYEDMTPYDLIFEINKDQYAFNEAVIFNLIEPTVYGIKEGVYTQTDELQKASSCLIYCHSNNVYTQYIPFHLGNPFEKLEYDWKAVIKVSQSEAVKDEVIIGSAGSSTNGYNRHYDKPKPPARPTINLQFNLYSDIDSHPFPIMHEEYKPDLTEDNESRYWDFAIDSGYDEPLNFTIEKIDVPEAYVVEMIIGEEVFLLSTEEESIYHPEEYPFVGQIRITKVPQTSIEDNDIPALSMLISNYPNPFIAGEQTTRGKSGGTNIYFYINKESYVKLDVYNIKGQKVSTLLDDKIEEGKHLIHWNGHNSYNKKAAAGIYFYRLTVDNKVIDHRKMLMLK